MCRAGRQWVGHEGEAVGRRTVPPVSDQLRHLSGVPVKSGPRAAGELGGRGRRGLLGSSARLGTPLGTPPPTSAPRRRHASAATAALVELWRTRHAITNGPGLGPRPADPDTAAAWDGLDARMRALTGRRPLYLPPADAPASGVIEAALGHLDAPPPGGPPPDRPALRDPFGIAPLSHGALDARLARRALTAVLAGEPLPDASMGEITAPGDDEDEQRTYPRLLTAIGDYRRRHHRGGP